MRERAAVQGRKSWQAFFFPGKWKFNCEFYRISSTIVAACGRIPPLSEQNGGMDGQTPEDS